jgi:hypothetical protein
MDMDSIETRTHGAVSAVAPDQPSATQRTLLPLRVLELRQNGLAILDKGGQRPPVANRAAMLVQASDREP